MIVVGRLSAVWQVAGVAVAALCCYLVSQSVAAERAGLAKVDRQIAQQQDAIAKLGIEIGTRSRLTQVESWNRQLALQAPRPGQYIHDGLQLASLYAHDTKPQLRLDPAIVTRQGPLEQTAYAAPASSLPRPGAEPAAPHAMGATPPVRPSAALGPNGASGLVMASLTKPALPSSTPSSPALARLTETHATIAAPAARPSAPPKGKGSSGSGLVLASLTRIVAAQPDAVSVQPPLRHATYVRARPSRLTEDDDAGAVRHTAFEPQTAASLLSSDIASLARAEQARKQATPKKSAR